MLEYKNEDKPSRIYQGRDEHYADVIKTPDWVLSLILLSIPMVNIIVIVFWALSDGINPNRRNFARAILIFLAIGAILTMMFFGMIMGMLSAMLGSLSL